MSRYYQLQNKGYSYENFELLLRRIDPKYFTYSQHSFKEIIRRKKFHHSFAEIIGALSNAASFDALGQDINIPGIAGMHSLAKYFFSHQDKYDINAITKKLLNNLNYTRVFLNTHVKLVKYGTKKPNRKNSLVFETINKEKRKSYDYIIIAFPLTKSISKQNFKLDILYRDFLDCEMNSLNEYIIDGNLLITSPNMKHKLINIYSENPEHSFKSIRTNYPIKKPIHSFFNLILYSVISSNELSTTQLDKLFEKGYTIVGKLTSYVVPLYKKVRYSHTPFPEIIIDEEKRSRIYYLKSQEWLIGGSKESNCMSARNIALLIAKKELGNNFYRKSSKKSFFNFNCKKIQYLINLPLFHNFFYYISLFFMSSN